MFATLALTVLAAGAAAQQKVTPTTPSSLVQCQPALIKWEGGSPPYFVSFIPGKQPSASPLVDFGTLNNNSLTWIVNQPEGTSLTLKVVDSTGADNFSSDVTVQKGSTSCMDGSSGGDAAAGGDKPDSSASAGGDAASPSGTDAPASDAPKPTESGDKTEGDKPATSGGASPSGSPSGSAAPSGDKTSDAASSPTSTGGNGASALGVSGVLAAVAVVAATLF